MRPSDLSLDLDTFSGPFDLLCSVLLRRELELADVRLAEIVVGYVQRLAMQEDVDPETASEFLLLIAALCEIKGRELLNAEEQATDELLDIVPADADVEMYERLIRYATFKGVARWLTARGSVPRYWRAGPRPVVRRRPSWDGPALDAALLARSMGVLLAEPNVDVRHLVGGHASVAEMAQRLLLRLQERDAFDFEESVEGCSRLDQAVAFVAALELCRSGRLSIEQAEDFGAITITRHVEEPQAPLVDDEDAATTSPAGATATEVQIA